MSLLLFFQDHSKQPETCNNYRGTAHKCECRHATECPDGEHHAEDSACQVYCRPSACKCLHPCTSHGVRPKRRVA